MTCRSTNLAIDSKKCERSKLKMFHQIELVVKKIKNKKKSKQDERLWQQNVTKISHYQFELNTNLYLLL